MVSLATLSDVIFGKVSGHSDNASGIGDVANLGAVLVVRLIVARRKWRMLFAMGPMMACAGVFGRGRANMIGAVLFFSLLLEEQRAHHRLVLLLLT